MLKVNNKDITKMCLRDVNVFIVNFEQIFSMILLLTL